MKQTTLPDAPVGNWVDRFAPADSRPYLRLMRADRPIGTWLLLIPCWWGAGLAALATPGQAVNLWHLTLFVIGSFVMRGAGCVWNDISDRDIDGQVERTASRPLPSGAVRLRSAYMFMFALALIGLLVLVQFNLTTILTGIASLAIVAIYPFMKRVSDFPQFILGLAFNWGVLVAWVAVHESFSLAPLLLYVAGIAWTLGYDTIYALQDIEDDAVVGVRSTARYFGKNVMAAIIFFYIIAALFVVLALIGVGAGIASYLGAVLLMVLLARQVAQLNPSDGQSALTAFRANRSAGLALCGGLFIDSLLRFGG